MTAEVFIPGGNRRKFIPVLRRGDWNDAAPSWLLGTYYIDLSSDPYSEANYQELLQTLHRQRTAACVSACAGVRGSEGVDRESHPLADDPARAEATIADLVANHAENG